MLYLIFLHIYKYTLYFKISKISFDLMKKKNFYKKELYKSISLKKREIYANEFLQEDYKFYIDTTLVHRNHTVTFPCHFRRNKDSDILA